MALERGSSEYVFALAPMLCMPRRRCGARQQITGARAAAVTVGAAVAAIAIVAAIAGISAERQGV